MSKSTVNGRNSLTHGTEPFLRSRQLRSHSRNCQHFMETKGSLPSSQEPPLVPILSQIIPVHTTPSYFSKIHFNITHLPTSWSSQWSLCKCGATCFDPTWSSSGNTLIKGNSSVLCTCHQFLTDGLVYYALVINS
jgi:hypothetical protein